MSSGMKPSSDPGLAQRLPAKRGRQVNLTLNGRDVTGFEGESLSGLLLAEQVWILQKDRGRELGLFCNIGQCHGCLVEVQGRGRVRACQTQVAEGMAITTGQEKKA
jgi:predicted molibdopterin-dependent oxidoreductase YjgC